MVLVHFLISLFVVFFTAIPLWLCLFHWATHQKWMKTARVIYFSLPLAWIGVGYYLFLHPEFLFEPHFQPNLFTRGVGLILFVFALIIDVNVIKTFGFRRLAMLPEFKQEKSTEPFVATGIYERARHPRYAEYVLIALSVGFFFGYTMMFGYAVYLLGSFWIATLFEELELVSRFGQAYKDYQKRVKRFFVI